MVNKTDSMYSSCQSSITSNYSYLLVKRDIQGLYDSFSKALQVDPATGTSKVTDVITGVMDTLGSIGKSFLKSLSGGGSSTS